MRLNTAVTTGRKGWGGKRQGAGRKPGPDVRVSLVISREVWKKIQQLAQQQGQAPETYAAEMLRSRLNDFERSEVNLLSPVQE